MISGPPRTTAPSTRTRVASRSAAPFIAADSPAFRPGWSAVRRGVSVSAWGTSLLFGRRARMPTVAVPILDDPPRRRQEGSLRSSRPAPPSRRGPAGAAGAVFPGVSSACATNATVRVRVPNASPPEVSPAEVELLYRAAEAHGLRPRLVLLSGKRPIQRGWPDRFPALAAVRAHLLAGGQVGIEPDSLGSVALDCDRGEADFRRLVDRAGLEAWAEQRTPGGGVHLFVRVPGPERNVRLPGGYGDVRGARGEVRLYMPGAIREGLGERWGGAKVEPLALLTTALTLPGRGFVVPKVEGLPAPAERERLRGKRATLRLDGPPIPKGRRRATLYPYAASRPRGWDSASMRAAAQIFNARRCRPPLLAAEVDEVVAYALAQRGRLLAEGRLNILQVHRGRKGGRKGDSAPGGRARAAQRSVRAQERREAIRALAARKPGLSQRAIAARFNCSQAVVSRALA